MEHDCTQTDRWTQIDRNTDGLADGRTNGRTEGRMDGSSNQRPRDGMAHSSCWSFLQKKKKIFISHVRVIPVMNKVHANVEKMYKNKC